jgi:hypothetical protein
MRSCKHRGLSGLIVSLCVVLLSAPLLPVSAESQEATTNLQQFYQSCRAPSTSIEGLSCVVYIAGIADMMQQNCIIIRGDQLSNDHDRVVLTRLSADLQNVSYTI